MPSRSAVAAATFALVTAALLTGCESSDSDDDGRLSVVASTNVYASIAASVGGDRVDATAFVTSPSQDPHSYEASGRDILAVSKADLVIENGGGYDDFMDQLLDSADSDPEVVNVVDVSRLPQPTSGVFNEHVWYDLPAMQRTADSIAAALGRVDPAHRSEYATRAEAFDGSVQKLIDREAALRPQLAGTGVAITEPVPGYLLDALGLVDKTPPELGEAVEDGRDVAVSVLAETLDLFSDHAVAALVYNEQTAGGVTDQVVDGARANDVPVVPVTETMPEGDEYVAWMGDNLERVATALGAPG